MKKPGSSREARRRSEGNRLIGRSLVYSTIAEDARQTDQRLSALSANEGNRGEERKRKEEKEKREQKREERCRICAISETFMYRVASATMSLRDSYRFRHFPKEQNRQDMRESVKSVSRFWIKISSRCSADK